MTPWLLRLMRNEHQRRRDVEAAYDDTYQPGPPDIADTSVWWGRIIMGTLVGLATIGALWLAGVL